jgi:hypothetical protein
MITEKAPQSVINEFIRISPIAWFYITFTGRYNFKKNTGKIDLQEILNTLEAKVSTTLWKRKKYKLVKQLSLLQSSEET